MTKCPAPCRRAATTQGLCPTHYLLSIQLPHKPTLTQRHREIWAKREAGHTYKTIGDELGGYTPQRIRQLHHETHTLLTAQGTREAKAIAIYTVAIRQQLET